MQAFEYASPATLKEAIGLLSPGWGETEILAGGTDLLALMKNWVTAPKRLVDIKKVEGLRGIRASRGDVRIGALVTLQELLDDAAIRSDFPALATAAEGVSSMQIRNRGTVGGDLCQRPRCWYFRSGNGLLAQAPEGRSLVVDGDNRYHAILGTEGPAYFVSASSLAPALVALGAKVRLAGPKGDRTVAVAEFFRAPRTEQERETVLEPNEILAEVLIPGEARRWRNATYEVRQKEALDWPLTTASVALRMDGSAMGEAHVVLGHVAPVPWRAQAAERALAGQTPGEATAERAAEAAVQGARPLSRNAYKVQLARVAVKRAVLAAAEGGA
ncbi:MAG: xanthine dehydrogenase family protein subunit M [Gemmatimonadetes bacterium]|nr:xanthine dehydrogenase family protein subunit M [Gemmatimonadota bacterium]